MMFIHKDSKYILRLVKERPGGVNTYLEVDEHNIPIVKHRPWQVGNQVSKQHYLVIGFDKLTEFHVNNVDQLRLF